MTNPLQGKSWQLLLGIGVALSLLTAPMAAFLMPPFAGMIGSSRDTMAIMFSVFGTLAMAVLAWRISPGISLLVAAYLISALNVGYQGLSMENTQTLLWGVALLLVLTEGWIAHKRTILWALVAVTAVHLLVGASQYFVSSYGWPAPAGLVWRDPFFLTHATVHEVEALTSHYSLFATFLVVGAPLLYLRLGWPILAIAAVVPLALQHRSGVALAVLGAFLLIPTRKRKLQVLAVGLILIGLVVWLRGSFSGHYSQGWFDISVWSGERMIVYTVTLAKALQKWVLGWGPGTFYLWKPTFVNVHTKMGLTYLQAHNEYLQLFFETGLVGLLAVPVWAVHTWRRVRRAKPWTPELRAAAASVILMACFAAFSFPFRIGVTSTLAIIAMAGLHGELAIVEREAARNLANATAVVNGKRL